MTAALALLMAVLVAPTSTAFAASGSAANARPPEAAHDSAQDDENSGDSAENPDEGTEANEAVRDSGDNSDEPGHHDESGDDGDESGDDGGDSGGSGPCTSVSNVTVCVDEPR